MWLVVTLPATQLNWCFKERKTDNAANEASRTGEASRTVESSRTRMANLAVPEPLQIGWFQIGRTNFMGSVLDPVKTYTI